MAGLDDYEYYNIDCDDIAKICIAIWKSMHPLLAQETEKENDIDDADVAMRKSLGEN